MSTLTTISLGGLSATVDSAGAQLLSLSLRGREYLWQRDPRWWGKTSPVLFPGVGFPPHEVQRSVAGPCRIGKHGFARDHEFELVDVDEYAASLTYELTDSSETRAVYPYPFKLQLVYTLDAPATLTQTFRVENTGAQPMPFSVGGHPAFNAPVLNEPEDECFEDYDLHFSRPWTYRSPKTNAHGLMERDDTFPVVEDSDVMPLTRACFDFDTVVLKDVPDRTITMTGRKSGRGVRLDFPGFDFVGVWSAQPDAPFVAIEPWTGHAGYTDEDDVLEHRDNVTILQPGEVDERSFKITLLAPHEDEAQVIVHGHALTSLPL